MKRMIGSLMLVAAVAAAPNFGVADNEPMEYEVGGPLFGVHLPLFPTQHGEPAGYPGCLLDEDGEFIHSPGGQHPQRQMYPDSVENFRYYWYHYLPVRNMFDRQSLLRNWLAEELAADRLEEYAAPVYHVPTWGFSRHVGKYNEPVPVTRTALGDPAFELDLGELDRGMYAVRIVGAVETEQVERHRKPLYIRMTVNDGLNGEQSSYRQRCGYVDEFYSFVEFFFHAPEKRQYRASLEIDHGSMVDVLIHNIDLHDVLAGAERRAIKSRSIHEFEPESIPAMRGDTRMIEDRLDRDRVLWESVPPINSQSGRVYGMAPDDSRSNWPNMGAGDLTPEEIEERYGSWSTPALGRGRDVDAYLRNAHILLRNEKLGLTYTMDDYIAGRPLPDPYPFKDDGRGVFTPMDDPDTPGQNWHPVADGIRDRWNRINHGRGGLIATLANQYREGDYDAGRDAVILLARVAHQYPAMDSTTAMSSVMVMPGPYGRDLRCRRRINSSFRSVRHHIDTYDALFPIIRDNHELAASINRFIPWVETPDDVIELFDVYLVQHLAKGYMRYQNQVGNQPHAVAQLAMFLGDNDVTLPWMEWTFTRSFTYPHAPAGIQDMLVSGHCRDGLNYIGSTYYVAHAIGGAGVLEEYVKHGGDPRFSLMDRERYPKVYESLFGGIRFQTAGLHFFRTGSVTGPEKGLGFQHGRMLRNPRRNWELTGHPDFAWLLVHRAGRDGETDEEWAAIETAAEGRRAPWLDLRSRVMVNLAGILESGIEHDDYRFRRSAGVRIGQGYGHAANDTLALQIHAHGIPMVIGGGQRHGYTRPTDTATRAHTVVQVDNRNHFTHAWIPSLTDAEGARYMRAEAAVQPVYQRQFALIDVDEGEGSVSLPPEKLAPHSELDPDVTTASSYVFDVFRVAGGSLHSYGFRANTGERIDSNSENNVSFDDMTEEEAEHSFLNGFSGERWAGDAPEHYVATLPIPRGELDRFLRPNVTDDTPDHFTRLHMLGSNARALHGLKYTEAGGLRYNMPMVHMQRRGEEGLESAFVAVIEPYAGEPFIDSIERYDIAGNENDALQAVALRVVLNDGREDLLFADGRPEMVRSFGGHEARGEFAYLSTDADGLRQATLSGGTLLRANGLVIRAEAGERVGVITDADHIGKRMIIDQPWTSLAGGERIISVGTPEKMTQYTALDIERAGDASVINVRGGADYYLSRVIDVDEEDDIVTTNIEIRHSGLDKNWTASNEDRTKFWRADYIGGDRDAKQFRFQLRGDTVSRDDFGELGGLYLWEYGEGDTVRQPTSINLRRTDDGTFEITADVAFSIRLPDGSEHHVSLEALEDSKGTVNIKKD